MSWRRVGGTSVGAAGLSLATLFLASLAPAPGRAGTRDGCTVSTFTSSDVPKAIPDPGAVESVLVVPAGDPITAVAVHVSITHPFDSDLKVELVSPAGKVVILAEAVGLWGHDFTSTIFDDTALSSILSQLPPFTGRFRPAEPLGAFAGSARGGAWKLRVTDLRARYAGQLVSWGLDITGCATPPAPRSKAVGAPDPPPLPTGVPSGRLPVEGTLITVNTAADENDAGPVTVAQLLANPGPDGTISLREAIEATNRDPGTYTIRFAPALKATTINVPFGLPPLQGGGVLIDGDIDGDGRPDVTIKNSATGGGLCAIMILSSNNRLHALVLRDFPCGVGLTASLSSQLPSRQTFAGNIVSGLEVTTENSGNGFVGGIFVGGIFSNPECYRSACETRNTWTDTRLVGNRTVSRTRGIGANLVGTIGDIAQGLTVVGNDIQIGTPGNIDGKAGIELSAGYSTGSNENRISNALVAYNTIEVSGKAYAISPTAGGLGGAFNTIEDLGIIGNRVRFSGIQASPDSARGISFAVSDGCAPGNVGLTGCSLGDALRRVRVVGNVFSGQDDAGVLLEDPCCGGGVPESNVSDVLIAENLIQGIVPPTELNPRGIVISGHTNVANVTIHSNTIEQETVDPQTDHVADLAGAGILVVGGLGSGIPGEIRGSIQNVSLTNNRIGTDLTGIAIIGGGPSDEQLSPNGDYGNAYGHIVSGVELIGNVIERAPVLATRWDANVKGIALIGGFTARSPVSGNWSVTSSCSVIDVGLAGNLVAGVLDDVSVRSNFGQGASGNIAQLGRPSRPPIDLVPWRPPPRSEAAR